MDLSLITLDLRFHHTGQVQDELYSKSEALFLCLEWGVEIKNSHPVVNGDLKQQGVGRLDSLRILCDDIFNFDYSLFVYLL